MNQQREIKFSSPETLPPPLGYSHVVGVRGGRTIYISGQTARDKSGAMVGVGDFRAQLTQVFVNLDLAIRSCGGSFADVVKLNYYCCDSVPLTDLPHVIAVRDRFVNNKAPPASTFVVVRRLVMPEWLIEIDAVVVVADDGRS
jgi:enamine deaminase RidA (YjgF/YER057c/UK114 family)